MPSVECRACKGTRGRSTRNGWVSCRACDGRGVNPDLWQTSCKSCYRPIIYNVKHNEPTYCSSCSQKEVTKRCAQWGCTNDVRYKLGWNNVSDYCRHCSNMRAKGFSPRTCSGVSFLSTCGKLFWVPPGKNFTTCSDCSQKERERKAAEWLTKRCADCGDQIKYHKDWDEPTYCKKCAQKEVEKTCAQRGCSNTFKQRQGSSQQREYCGRCHKMRESGASADTCKDCGGLLWVPQGKNWKRCQECNGKPGTAVTHLNYRGQGHQHTTYSLRSGLRRSYDHDKGENIRNDHFSEGPLGTSVDRKKPK